MAEDTLKSLTALAVMPAACLLVATTAIVLPTQSSAQQPSPAGRSSVQGERPASKLSGTVVDTSGAVVAGASVSIRDPNGTVVRATRSDRNGDFTVPGLYAGSYRAIVSSPSFETTDLAFTLNNSSTPMSLRITLQAGAVVAAVDVQGREDDLTGIADSSSQGTVGAAELQDRPILRSGEILEAVPGVIITQHAGGGKANQYFLRGFNLDHGTDFAIFVDAMPLNLPSHAHGEGYSDMNTVIPELVRRVDYEKGPYYANVGNYGSAGAAHLEFFKSLPQDFLQLEGGMYGYGRLVFGACRTAGPGTLLFGGEAAHENGPWTHPDNYYKFNGLMTYGQGGDERGFSFTARGYHGSWHSSDQIAATAVPLVGLFGTLDPTDGGNSQRYSLQGEWHHQGANARSTVAAYGFRYALDLFSDFTYFLTDPLRGDQFEQQDARWVAGLDARHTLFSTWHGRRMESTVGLQVRNDWIHNGLFQSQDRVRTPKSDVDSGTTLPATTQADRFTDTQIGLYAENHTQWAKKFRSEVGLRGDVQRFDVTSLVNQANSGTALKALPSPKASLVLGPWFRTELYAQAGFSFHSNDGRGTTLRVQPVSADNPYPDTPATPIPALIPTKGGEFGIRSTAVPHLQSTLSLWYLHSASELQQDGDTGTTVASQQPSERYGFEWANFYTPLEHMALDLDVANSKALFTQTDAGDAAPGSPGGKRVPEAVGWVIASGLTFHDSKRFSSSLRVRTFGPRDLTSDGLFRSRATILLNAEVGYQFGERWHISVECLNLLNRKDHDIDYAYASRVSSAATPAFTDVFHPVEPFQARFFLRRTF